ncbi:MT-A70-domain-containing protein [Meira miltonrushii]|uniref:mRNA m(6)A methyltransferase n=1 Tax=Meira miltonrushii TaxID=1280837 RepID=A0A316VCQ5_9BASI|nr:MT-A70-domain-containing protein [Meira miltonrushii]PWN35447.1 MT-A70-domain-containing protein [Meira miltonrushii]
MTEEFGTRGSAASKIAEKYLSQPTAKQKLLLNAFRAPDSRYQPICRFLTLKECALDRSKGKETETTIDDACDDVHFEPIIYPQTDMSLGHCSYLNTCHRTSRCKYLHFNPVRRPNAPPFEWQTIYDDDPMPIRRKQTFVEALIRHPARALHADGLEEWSRDAQHSPELTPAQWIDADLKSFDYSMLGKFDVIVADPPWDIHMSLPYGTMSDDDMRAMPFPQLQDEGFLFLWVTGRAMELGRELLSYWGYTRTDEIIWVKVGQTQRLIRTGRTGHWLNHTKEHCLVGVKVKNNKPDPRLPIVSTLSPPSSVTYPASHAPGIPANKLLPSWANAGLDADVIVAEVRDTSRKPDELYNIIERLCPKGRKIELFGRRHNARPGWITVGNQLKGDHIVDVDLKRNVEAWRRKAARA